FIVGGPVGDFELLLCHGTVCVVGKMRDLILQLSKSSIYSTKPHHCLLLTSYRSAIAVYDAYVGRRVDEPSRDRRMIRPDINSLVLLPCVQNCFCGFHL
ncbi:hypothetical protein DM078_25260, partial [Klebsiella pneumoniae]